MTDSKALRTLIAESGYKVGYIAERCGLSRQCFHNRMSGRTQFELEEVKVLKSLLRLSAKDVERIFFADDVDKIQTKKGAQK